MRKLCAFAFPFAGAVFAAAYFFPRGLLVPAGVFCALGSLLGLLFRGDGRKRAVLIALGLAVGLLWFRGYDALMVDGARALDGQTLRAEAVVDAYPRQTAYGWSLTVRLELPDRPEVKTVLYTDADCAGLLPGDRLSFAARFRLADSLGGEDSRYWFSHGVYLLAYGQGEPECARPEAFPLRYWPAALAQRLRETISALYPPDRAGLMWALVTGDRTGLSDSFYAALKRCGLAHVVAVSGMHLTFLAGLVQTLTGRKNRRRAAIATIPALLLFMAMTGFPASVVRAGVMQILLLLAPALGREGDVPTSLSLALLLLLLVNPNAAADMGLQLSFAAAAGIQLFSGRLDRWAVDRLKLEKGKTLPRRLLNGAARFLTGCVAASLGALALTTPLTAYYFGTISLIAPLANLLGLWAVSFAFGLGLLSALAGLLWLPAGQALALLGGLPARYLLWLAPALARFPYAAVPVKDIYLWLWLVLVYVLLLCALLWRRERSRPLIPLGACALSLAAAVALSGLTYTAGDLTVSVLDVGQGLCVVFRSAGHTVVVDCGGSAAENAGDIAADYVQSLGSAGIDMLVLTHYHTDHANGVAELLERLEVPLLVLPDVEEDDTLRREILTLAEEKGTEVFLLEDDAEVTFGQAGMRIYAPLGAGDTNEEGLSVLASCGDFEALVTGDMGAAVEKRLVKYGDLPDIELLVVGHHGSRYASGEELLLATTPEYAVISVGANNKYGHPAEETLERLGAAGCDIYRTDLMGTVTFTADTGG